MIHFLVTCIVIYFFAAVVMGVWNGLSAQAWARRNRKWNERDAARRARMVRPPQQPEQPKQPVGNRYQAMLDEERRRRGL